MMGEKRAISFEYAENSLKAGDVAPIREYFQGQSSSSLAIANRATLKQEKYNILHELIDASERFADPAGAFYAITEGLFDFDDFFIHSYGIVDSPEIFGLYAAMPTPEIADIAGVLLAEYLKHQLSWNRKYSFDVGQAIKAVASSEEKSLTAESKRIMAMNAVIAVQNAMVDYVFDNSGSFAPDSAARYLTERKKEFKHIAPLWTQKIESIQEIKVGSSHTPVNYKPIFEPK